MATKVIYAFNWKRFEGGSTTRYFALKTSAEAARAQVLASMLLLTDHADNWISQVYELTLE